MLQTKFRGEEIHNNLRLELCGTVKQEVEEAAYIW